MKRCNIVGLLLFAVGVGCDRPDVKSDGSRWFGEQTLNDGTKKAKRIEFRDGQKDFDETFSPDGTRKIGRVELSNGGKFFEENIFPDGTRKIVRAELPSGAKSFDVTLLPDGTKKIQHEEFPNGEKAFGVTVLPDGTSRVARVEEPSGENQFDVTQLPDGTRKVGRTEQRAAGAPAGGNDTEPKAATGSTAAEREGSSWVYSVAESADGLTSDVEAPGRDAHLLVSCKKSCKVRFVFTHDTEDSESAPGNQSTIQVEFSNDEGYKTPPKTVSVKLGEENISVMDFPCLVLTDPFAFLRAIRDNARDGLHYITVEYEASDGSLVSKTVDGGKLPPDILARLEKTEAK